jgi:zinc/manganese transport system permease protein
MMLVVINLVAGFQALGTLMAVGLMMLPAISAKLWAKSMAPILLLAMVIALVCSWGGLVLSYHIEVPSGPAIIILCGVVYTVSLVFGLHGGVLAKFLRGKHHQV